MEEEEVEVSFWTTKNEWIKQPRDQTLHMLWGGVPWWLALWLSRDVLGGGLWGYAPMMIAGATTYWFIAREIEQWPSKRWWDPYTDWLFFGIGTGLGIWLGLR